MTTPKTYVIRIERWTSTAVHISEERPEGATLSECRRIMRETIVREAQEALRSGRTDQSTRIRLYESTSFDAIGGLGFDIRLAGDRTEARYEMWDGRAWVPATRGRKKGLLQLAKTL